MKDYFYSLEMLVLMHIADRGSVVGTREYCDRGFLDALATENNQ